MTKDKKVNFDLSALSLSELISVYEDLTNFIIFLEEKLIQEEGEDKSE